MRKPLPLLYYMDWSEEPSWRALGYLLQCRRNGFIHGDTTAGGDCEMKAQLQAAADGEPPIFPEPAVDPGELEIEPRTGGRRRG